MGFGFRQSELFQTGRQGISQGLSSETESTFTKRFQTTFRNFLKFLIFCFFVLLLLCVCVCVCVCVWTMSSAFGGQEVHKGGRVCGDEGSSSWGRVLAWPLTAGLLLVFFL